MTDPIRLGVALTLPSIAPLRDWIFDHDRAVEMQDFVGPDVFLQDPGDLIGALNAALDGHRGPRGIHGPFFGLDLSNPDAEIRAIVTARLLRGVTIAERLGADHMVIHSPFTFWHVLNRVNYAGIRSAMLDAMAGCLTPVLARAASTGCTLMLENIDDTDPGARLELVETMGHPRLMVSVDTGHAELAHHRYGAPPLVDHLDLVAARLGHVHLQDVDGHADRHWHPGEGCILWPPVFAAIGRAPAPPRLILEVRDGHERLPVTVARLAHCGVG